MTYDFMMYRIMIVALAQNYHIALVSWTLLIICCNKDPTDLLRNLITMTSLSCYVIQIYN